MPGFRESVRSCAYEQYSQFGGRTGRAEFWWFILALFLINCALIVIGIFIPAIQTSILGGFSLVILSPFAAALTRRLHDIGLSGKWVAAAFIVAILAGTAGSYPAFSWAKFLTPAAFGILFLASLLPGSRTENRFGPVP